MKKILLSLTILIVLLIFYHYNKSDINIYKSTKPKDKLMTNLSTIEDVEIFQDTYPNIIVNIKYEYNDKNKNEVISQSIQKDENIEDYQQLDVTISLGKFNQDNLEQDNINELGKVPIMMYHGIVDIESSQTKYIGGNVDIAGYTRTTEAFREDLEFYYQNNYRMIKLKDYINGNITTEYSKSPIILTFDDGNENNFKVTGLDSEGNILIDPNCAIGILESFKKKYPDYNVTATFFVNDTLFNQKEYNNKILKWLVDNDYDIGNHTKGHINIKEESSQIVNDSIGYVYNQLDNIIKDQYVNIVALPFGSPYTKEHPNFQYILNSTYNNNTYETVATLRVGWEPELSPYHRDFDKTFLKRCRAYDNNNEDFDISMVFNNLENTKYISDGNADTVVIPCKEKENITNNLTKSVKCY